MNDLRDKVSVSMDTDSTPKKENYVQTPVDFDELKKINPDIYAWIEVPGTVINYPILRSEDNKYYLNHTVEGKKSAYGSIYTETYNAKDFSDFSTIIYGHNMKNGTMFGQLKKFRDKNFFNKNRYIFIYTPGRIMKYEIFGAYTWSNEHVILSHNFDSKANRRVYLDEIFSIRDMNSQIKRDIKVTENAKVLTLSTCMNNDAKRLLVSGVLVYDSRNE